MFRILVLSIIYATLADFLGLLPAAISPQNGETWSQIPAHNAPSLYRLTLRNCKYYTQHLLAFWLAAAASS